MIRESYNLYVAVNGTSLCYDDCGEGEVPILFIHGFPFDKSSWLPQKDALKKNHRVILLDVRGYGKSASGMEPPGIPLFADDLILFMDQLRIKKAIICGISMGGYILMNAVNRFPERFTALILCDTQCIADSPEARSKRDDSIAQIESGKLVEFADQFIKKVFSADIYRSNTYLITRIKNIILSTAPDVVIGGLRALKQRDEMCASLAKVSLPTLVICGEEDVLTPPHQSELLHRQIHGSEFYLIPKAGHLSNLEQPLFFNQRISEFISSVLSNPGVLAMWE